MGAGNKVGWKLRLGAGVIVASILGLVAPFSLDADAAAAAAVPADVTFTKDIAPILQRSCQNCHRPDGVAPMSLVTYEDVRPWARAIKQRTGIGPKAGVMPPWYIEKNIGIQKFQERSVAERRRDRDDREVGRQRRAARQPGRHAAAEASTRTTAPGRSARPI